MSSQPESSSKPRMSENSSQNGMPVKKPAQKQGIDLEMAYKAFIQAHLRAVTEAASETISLQK